MMPDAPDAQRSKLLQALDELHQLDRLLTSLEPSLRKQINGAWHVCNAAKWMAADQRRIIEIELRELDDREHRAL